eukprot:GEMP01080377.1.p1 GENE.GEMP01080377.1~~GEMP01080377.1.p1  ORF type:complete len:243 (+),score=55.17 GEMP01080377.1:87-815(+)
MRYTERQLEKIRLMKGSRTPLKGMLTPHVTPKATPKAKTKGKGRFGREKSPPRPKPENPDGESPLFVRWRHARHDPKFSADDEAVIALEFSNNFGEGSSICDKYKEQYPGHPGNDHVRASGVQPAWMEGDGAELAWRRSFQIIPYSPDLDDKTVHAKDKKVNVYDNVYDKMWNALDKREHVVGKTMLVNGKEVFVNDKKVHVKCKTVIKKGKRKGKPNSYARYINHVNSAVNKDSVEVRRSG